MERVDEPKVTRKIKPVLPGADLAALLRAREGQDFEARRDMAISRIFIDTGVRVSGLANVQTAAVSLSAKTIRVVLKGGDERARRHADRRLEDAGDDGGVRGRPGHRARPLGARPAVTRRPALSVIPHKPILEGTWVA
jgi:integrase